MGWQVLEMRRLGRLVITIAAIGAGCGPTSGALQQPSRAQAAETSDIAPRFSHPVGLPVDPTLTPVSRSHPSEDAAAAMKLCVFGGNLDYVEGMAQLPANRVRLFALSAGREAVLQGDQLVWAIQLKGQFPALEVPDIIDPLCVVRDGDFTMFAPYGDVSGTFTPPPGFVWPVYALPPLTD